jgi:23S rRNA pseudouridine2605 synthase
MSPMSDTVRISKALADAAVASRRAADAMVAAGRVTVNGTTAVLGQRIDPARDVMALDGRPVARPGRRTYLVLNKPVGVTSTVKDRHAARTVLELVPDALAQGSRLYPVGRLDRDSEGLLLLTDDGDWTQRLLHPSHGVEREYAVGLERALDAEQRRALEDGVQLEEGLARLASLRLATRAEATAHGRTDEGAPLVWYRAVLTQGWKRQIRRMLAVVGTRVERLVRVRIGTLRLGDLAPGAVRPLTRGERDSLAKVVASR